VYNKLNVNESNMVCVLQRLFVSLIDFFNSMMHISGGVVVSVPLIVSVNNIFLSALNKHQSQSEC
jgi:hypothetical protein